MEGRISALEMDLFSAAVVILQLCSPLTCFQVAGRERPGLRAQCWLINHFESLSCHAWHLASAANAVTRHAFESLCLAVISLRRLL